MSRRPVKLLATDLDGTLLGPDGRVGRRTRKAIAQARAAGLHVVPITARPPYVTYDIVAAAGIDGLAGCSNGAFLVDVAAREVLSVDPIDAAACHRIAAEVRHAIPGVRMGIDAPDGFLHEPGFLTGAEGWEDVAVEVADVLDHVQAEGAVKLVLRCDGASTRQMLTRMEDVLGQEAHATSSSPGWIEISAFGVTKAFALVRLCERLGISIDETVAVGDGLNDLPMIAAAGVGCAVRNAHPDVLAAADHVVPSNKEEGVATLILECLRGEVGAR